MGNKKTFQSAMYSHTHYKKGKKAGELKSTMYTGGSYPDIYKHNAGLQFTGKSENIMADFNMTEGIAYRNKRGLYLHSWVINFERSLQSLNFQEKIQNILQPHINYYNNILDKMITSLEVDEDEQKIIERIKKPSSILQLFQSLKKNKNKLVSFLRSDKNKKDTKQKNQKSTNKKTRNTIATGSAQLNKELTTLAGSNKNDDVLNSLHKEITKKIKMELSKLSTSDYNKDFIDVLNQELTKWVESLNLEQILISGNLGDRITAPKAEKIEDVNTLVNGVSNFYILGKAFEIAANECKKCTPTTNPIIANQNYANAVKTLRFLEMLNEMNFDDFTKVDSTVFVRRFGFFFEPLAAVMYGGTVVGHLNNDTTATDVLLTFDRSMDNLNKALTASLKTGALIYRTQQIKDFFISDLKNKKSDEAVQANMRPIKYFYLNFALLMEYQTVLKHSRERATVKDIPVVSSEEIMGIYNYLANALGKYYFTNMIVGYFLKNGTKNDDLKTLPKIIFNSNDQQIYETKDVLTKVRRDVVQNNNHYNMAFIHANITGKMVEDYLQFCYHKSKRKGYLEQKGKTVTYEKLTSSNAGGEVMKYYKELSKDAESMNLVTAVDLAVMMEQNNVL